MGWILKLLLLALSVGGDRHNTVKKIKQMDLNPCNSIKSDEWYRRNGKL